MDFETELVLKRMEEIRPEDLVDIKFTVAELRPDDPYSDQVRRIILPVKEYIHGDMGYEIMPVEMLVKNDPWHIEKTLVKINTEHTNVDGYLHNIVVEDKEVHKHLTALEGGKN